MKRTSSLFIYWEFHPYKTGQQPGATPRSLCRECRRSCWILPWCWPLCPLQCIHHVLFGNIKEHARSIQPTYIYMQVLTLALQDVWSFPRLCPRLCPRASMPHLAPPTHPANRPAHYSQNVHTSDPVLYHAEEDIQIRTHFATQVGEAIIGTYLLLSENRQHNRPNHMILRLHRPSQSQTLAAAEPDSPRPRSTSPRTWLARDT